LDSNAEILEAFSGRWMEGVLQEKTAFFFPRLKPIEEKGQNWADREVPLPKQVRAEAELFRLYKCFT
jgi:hypothetical protein